MLDDFGKKINSNSVIFIDLDGTLVDTDIANTQSYLNALRELSNFNAKNLHYSKRLTKIILKEFGLSNEQIDWVVKRKRQIYPMFLSKTKVNDNLLKFIEKFYKNYHFYLVSSGDEQRIKQTLQYHQLQYLFKGIICHPQNKYAYALDLLALSANQVFVFENCKTEIENALKAGVLAHQIVYTDGDYFYAA
ncbi:HAD hydrolase-like protein [Moraxella nasovis]|uniref:HAD hydrolase-like protein n=1 Tax=Moraxella nasovis TaxID=2904121 RepID=UPI001F61CE16|nr:HAD hydrolase-like protein [Moraxella nasovis]UNU73170.1 HAD hydrolase-like protein [Moraxella nasovis]